MSSQVAGEAESGRRASLAQQFGGSGLIPRQAAEAELAHPAGQRRAVRGASCESPRDRLSSLYEPTHQALCLALHPRRACLATPGTRGPLRRRPQIADGLFLRAWKSGPEKGQPKLPPAARSMLGRGLIEIKPARIGYAAFLTEAGLAALRQLVLDARAMNPSRFGHLREQLGLQTRE